MRPVFVGPWEGTCPSRTNRCRVAELYRLKLHSRRVRLNNAILEMGSRARRGEEVVLPTGIGDGACPYLRSDLGKTDLGKTKTPMLE